MMAGSYSAFANPTEEDLNVLKVSTWFQRNVQPT